MYLPSSESAGATNRLEMLPERFCESSGSAKLRGRCSSATVGRYLFCMACFHSALSSSRERPISRRKARSMPRLGTAFMISPMTSSPQRAPTYCHTDNPYRYGKYLSGRSVICAMVGSALLVTASRTHASVHGCLSPIEKYSASPSMNQSGGLTIARFCNPAPARPREKMSN